MNKLRIATEYTYSVYKYDINSKKVSHRENINNDELDEWMEKVYGKYPAVKVIRDQDKKELIYVDDGKKWDKL